MLNTPINNVHKDINALHVLYKSTTANELAGIFHKAGKDLSRIEDFSINF